MADEQQPFMTRRGFFQRLFGGEDRVDASFFGLQVVFDAAGQEELRERIQAHLDDAETESVDDKRRFYKILTSLLREAEPYYDYAYFELVMGARDAEESFSEWVHDIEAGIATEEEETSDDIDGYHRMDNSQRYIVVSILLHFEGKHPLYGKHEASLDQIYTRAGIGALVESVNRVNFEHLLGDAAFLVPGSPEDGFSSLDFADEGWAHLRPMNF
jgi:hypothetical protein